MKSLTKASSKIRNGIFDLNINYPFSMSYGKNYNYNLNEWWNTTPNGYYIRITFNSPKVIIFERREFNLKELNYIIKSILDEISTFFGKNSKG